MPQAHVRDAVLGIARDVPGYPDLRVLDLSCGQGEVLSLLARDGCDPRGSRFTEGDPFVAGRESLIDAELVDDGVDLTRRLPYEDGTWDLVLLTEVVEHLADPSGLLREVARILRPGGHLILTAPNIQRLHSRAWFLVTGHHKVIGHRPGWGTAYEDMYACHQNPPYFPLLHTSLYQAGLRVQGMRCTRIKWRHACWGLLWPLVALCTRRELRRGASSGAEAEGRADLRKWMTGGPMLFSEQIALLARREASDSRPRSG